MSKKRARRTRTWAETLGSVLDSPAAKAAYDENNLRREISKVFRAEKEKRGLSLRKLANVLGISISQTQRLLHEDLGGPLNLLSIVQAANALGLKIKIDISANWTDHGADFKIGTESVLLCQDVFLADKWHKQLKQFEEWRESLSDS